MSQYANLWFGVEEMKKIPTCDLFYCIVFNTMGPLLEFAKGNKYVSIVIDHNYSNKEIIYRFNVSKFILIDNGSEWMKEFDVMYKNCGITYQFIALTWLQCNGMVKHLI